MAPVLNGFAHAEVPTQETTRLHALVPFLDQLERRPFVWGECDCLLACADWVEWLVGVDPASHLRGTYSTQLGAERILSSRTPVGILEDCAKMVHAEEIAEAEAMIVGDVALAQIPQGRHTLTVGSIYCGMSRFAVKTADGLVIAQLGFFVPAWRVPCP